LAQGTKPLFDGFAKLDVALRHLGSALARPKERQHPVKPSGTLFGVAPPGPLRSGALSRVVDQMPSGIGLRCEDRNQAVAVDTDE